LNSSSITTHRRFLQQAEWTASLRNYAITKLPHDLPISVLEVGSGTGAVINCIPPNVDRFGVDIDLAVTKFAQTQNPSINFVAAEGGILPFPDRTFNLTYCHYLLLWVAQPKIVLDEMIRVTKKGGMVAAFAEPDYGLSDERSTISRRIHALQAQSLLKKGANPFIGHKVLDLFNNLDLQNLETKQILNKVAMDTSDLDLELRTIYNDLLSVISEREAKKLVSQYRAEINNTYLSPHISTFLLLDS